MLKNVLVAILAFSAVSVSAGEKFTNDKTLDILDESRQKIAVGQILFDAKGKPIIAADDGQFYNAQWDETIKNSVNIEWNPKGSLVQIEFKDGRKDYAVIGCHFGYPYCSAVATSWQRAQSGTLAGTIKAGKPASVQQVIEGRITLVLGEFLNRFRIGREVAEISAATLGKSSFDDPNLRNAQIALVDVQRRIQVLESLQNWPYGNFARLYKNMLELNRDDLERSINELKRKLAN